MPKLRENQVKENLVSEEILTAIKNEFHFAVKRLALTPLPQT
jgi:hypothetical protein